MVNVFYLFYGIFVFYALPKITVHRFRQKITKEKNSLLMRILKVYLENEVNIFPFSCSNFLDVFISITTDINTFGNFQQELL